MANVISSPFVFTISLVDPDLLTKINLSPYREQFTNLMTAVIEFDTVTITIAFELTHRCMEIWKAAQQFVRKIIVTVRLSHNDIAHTAVWDRNPVELLSSVGAVAGHIRLLNLSLPGYVVESGLNLVDRVAK
ncbi:hypothetical protein PGT21_021697 [Puccinia graminis f. sp. tritici]|uniref:Uncharacterized protein n=1 Tax=Puccinia graminis f. sp. tritici TaxID=56615 RepID=A0A5B0P8U4_PUCGR|nr:hypothetical protein PGT21_021697 [Puccinia graminis f. sp. tritici]KAA1117197.1 hypothetical protein PGTUg99_036931 [Puccinia graminis f. sp. tritici]